MKKRRENNFKIVIVILFLIISKFLVAEEVSVSLFHDRKIQGITLTVQKGSYIVFDGKKIVDTLEIGTNITVIKESDYLVYRNRSKAFASDQDLVIVNRGEASFFLNYTGSVEPAKNFEGWLRIKRTSGFIYVINYIELDQYIAGIIEAERGTLASEEYYKAIAVILRTSIFLNLGKHKSEGFDFCDSRHCYLYKNRAGSRLILQAAKKTNKQVIVDNSLNMINPVYHINSGGLTTDGSVLGISSDYLQPVVDTFAIYGQSYQWKLLIPGAEWQQYLVRKGIKSAQSKLFKDLLIDQKNTRLISYKLGNDNLKVDDVRNDLNWNSAFFSMSIDKSGVITVNGRGNGHGVGLSLESAFNMAAKGYKYEQILYYFYKNTKVVSCNSLLIYSQLERELKNEKPL
ncbi:MAG TPA: SpoIID/LytB domain-containing protein [Bacteroidales bacterium]|jgi:stage II sporulation protein D|nr:SpoIID/LytB domain-containing protein [Bacteroidales bacterium]HOL97539.1 SpoIID/LytB domain-containing protein [Bacteroidales bacterium]HOM35807.1 SpoIID/LytB domain-containing protein [Bacteroidales bacterium]HPD22975.1 SpoIID/LytB domain-containing protein [Bacteroidales bacterium]HRS98814.1 SpoIID/LytB domain-containing protein [Bacteroidales bacterium]